jgi:TldD protein
MKLTRRQFLYGSGGVAACALSGLDFFSRERLADARGLLTEPILDEAISRALAAAKLGGATYADVRIVRRRHEFLATREDRVRAVNLSESFGLGVRVLASGTWGFSASNLVDGKEAERTAQRAVEIARENGRVTTLLKRKQVELSPEPVYVDVWQTPIQKDPFKIPIEDKAELLFAINREAMKVAGVKFCSAHFSALGEWKLFASSEGTYIEQNQTRLGPGYHATAVDAKSGEFESRGHELPPMQAGWEYVEAAPLLKDARRIGEEAVEKL